MQMKSLSGQQQCRQYNFQPGLLVVSTWVGILTLGWSVNTQVQGQKAMCKYQNWPHSPAYRYGIEYINQRRPGYGVNGLTHKGSHPSLSSATSECFPCWFGNMNNCVIFIAPISLGRENMFIGASAFCFRGSSVAILINFDKTYLHSHYTEAAAEEIPLALRIWGGYDSDYGLLREKNRSGHQKSWFYHYCGVVFYGNSITHKCIWQT